MMRSSFATLALAAAALPAVAQDARFEPVQAEDFAVPGSLAIGWADYDGDGDLDFAVSTKADAVILYRNDGGVFTEATEEAGLPANLEETRGLSWGDFDGDGDADLLVGSSVYPDPTRSYVYRNDAGVFTEVAEEIGLAIPGRYSRQANWVDFDNDGDLDLYAADRGGMNRLYVNHDGAFEPASDAAGPADDRPTVGACWFDYDQDGRLDLFLANQSQATDALWRNGEDGFEDVAAQAGVEAAGRPEGEGGVGCAIGDYDNDGRLDVFVAAYGANLLYRNLGDGTFEEVGEAMGVDQPRYAVAASWADYDNDGRLDLFVVGYEYGEPSQIPTNALYRNLGDRFEDVTGEHPELNVGTHGIAWVDYDQDGRVDLSLTKGYGETGGHFVFRNQGGRADGTGLNVLALDAEGRFLEPGAEIRVYDADGALLGTRLMDSGGGYNSQSMAPVHFGLASNDPVSVEAAFMSESGRVTVRVDDVDPAELAGRPLTLRRAP